MIPIEKNLHVYVFFFILFATQKEPMFKNLRNKLRKLIYCSLYLLASSSYHHSMVEYTECKDKSQK